MSVLKKPLITEKLTAIAEKHKQYGFVVDKNATKPQIRAAIENMYNVNVTSIATMVYAGKRKAKHTKAGPAIGRNNAFKKAIVKLKEGQSIDFFENV
jgi:large subunit ribosomal protein L23